MSACRECAKKDRRLKQYQHALAGLRASVIALGWPIYKHWLFDDVWPYVESLIHGRRWPSKRSVRANVLRQERARTMRMRERERQCRSEDKRMDR